jgi:hypothetical protein
MKMTVFWILPPYILIEVALESREQAQLKRL